MNRLKDSMASSGGDAHARRRRALVKEIEQEVRSLQGLLGRAELDPRVMEALRRVPRHEFVGVQQRSLAYINHPLPIGHQQTISQPFIVALMTDLLGVGAEARVLEIGTGSGYQAAVLAEIVAEVYSVEFIDTLARSARERLERLGYSNVAIKSGDGREGWPEHAPYDGIVVTAAARSVPGALLEQLGHGARLVIPIGAPGQAQSLDVVEWDEAGNTVTRSVLPVAFVPLVQSGH